MLVEFGSLMVTDSLYSKSHKTRKLQNRTLRYIMRKVNESNQAYLNSDKIKPYDLHLRTDLLDLSRFRWSFKLDHVALIPNTQFLKSIKIRYLNLLFLKIHSPLSEAHQRLLNIFIRNLKIRSCSFQFISENEEIPSKYQNPIEPRAKYPQIHDLQTEIMNLQHEIMNPSSKDLHVS